MKGINEGPKIRADIKLKPCAYCVKGKHSACVSIYCNCRKGSCEYEKI